MSFMETDKAYVANTYNRFDLLITGGKGSLVWDENGKEYIEILKPFSELCRNTICYQL